MARKKQEEIRKKEGSKGIASCLSCPLDSRQPMVGRVRLRRPLLRSVAVDRPNWLSFGLIVLCLQACASSPEPGVARVPEIASEQRLNERAVLLELADRKLFEPVIVQRALQSGPEARVALATALGRIGDGQGVDALQTLLIDHDAEVRRAAAFNLGLLGDADSVPALLQAVSDEDPETGRLAVEALGKMKTPLARVLTALNFVADPGKQRKRLLPSLFRFHELAALPVARAGLSSPDSDDRRWAAYALAREPFPEALSDLRLLLQSPDPPVRAWSARALGKVGVAADLQRLLPLLADEDSGAVIEALRAGQALVGDGRAAPADSWRGPLLDLLNASAPGIRLTAIEASSRWLLDEAIGDALVSKVDTAKGRERVLALQALASGKEPRAAARIERAAASRDPSLRAAAAGAAADFGADTTLLRLGRDPDFRVRMAAIAEVLERQAPAVRQVRARALRDPDPGVRAIALDDLTEHPVEVWQQISLAMEGPGSGDMIDVRISGVQALQARAAAADGERAAAEERLVALARDENYLVRRAAHEALDKLGVTSPSPEPLRTGKDLEAYKQVVETTRRRPLVTLLTERGEIRLRLDCPEAPLTCLNFIQLAAQGYFDGLTFHRVVPDFVVQGGDPLGNGWGGPGYAIRDEINRLRYDHGTLGMALSGPDTGGSQFFITLTPQPHLDGRYTVFGHVVGGDAVLEQLIQGDLIESVTVADAPGLSGVQ